jgi:uroporphyrinogen-III decarboxylase
MAVIGLMPFQQFIAFMGFTNGLMAMVEEPEAVKELLHFMTDVYMPVVQAAVDYYEPDMLYLLDDTATNLNPFISTAMFRDILKPVYKRLTQPAVDRGIPIQFHNCGRCEDFIDDMLDIGTTIWDPAQVTNDLAAIKNKYGRRFAMAGGFWMPVRAWADYREDEVRQAVRDCIDRYAPGGGFLFAGGVGGIGADPAAMTVNGWVQEEAYRYGRDYYLK